MCARLRETFCFSLFADNFTGSKDTETYKTDVFFFFFFVSISKFQPVVRYLRSILKSNTNKAAHLQWSIFYRGSAVAQW